MWLTTEGTEEISENLRNLQQIWCDQFAFIQACFCLCFRVFCVKVELDRSFALFLY